MLQKSGTKSVPIDIRNSNSLSEFTTEIMSWKPVTCLCNLCHTSVGQVGYIISYPLILFLQKRLPRRVAIYLFIIILQAVGLLDLSFTRNGFLPGCFSRILPIFAEYHSFNFWNSRSSSSFGGHFLVAASVVSIYSVIFIWKSVFNLCKLSVGE